MAAIRVERLCKEYRRYRRPLDRVKEVLPFLRPRYEAFHALRDVSFEVAVGETVGIVGQNGAGKSTLLQVLSGVLEATSGRHEVHGRVGSLLELGAGFHPDFEGVDNVRLQGRLLGLPESFVEDRLPDILAFADIGDFATQPVRTYSSGMFVRLAFSTAVHFDPEVLIVDEALSVGDVFFQHKCIARIERFREEGKTILVVSHDPQTIRHLCDRALHLSHGRLVADGRPDDVVSGYLHERVARGVAGGAAGDGRAAREERTASPAGVTGDADALPPLPADLGHRGEGGARLVAAALRDAEGRVVRSAASGDRVDLVLRVRAERDLAAVNLGFMLRDKKGLDVSGSNLAFEGGPTPPLAAGALLDARFRIDLPELASGSYAFALAAVEGDHRDYRILDWVDHALVLELRSRREILGHIRMDVDAEAGMPAREEQP
ncbi:MAG: ABC transporter ATP-binding protein [Planctomycetota bacterium]